MSFRGAPDAKKPITACVVLLVALTPFQQRLTSQGSNSSASQSKECQISHWPSHKSKCRSMINGIATISYSAPSSNGDVVSVLVPCDGERRINGIFKSVTIPPTHPIYVRGVVSPVSKAVGFPVVLYRHLPEGGVGSEYDCQIATYLMIDTFSGWAPFEYVLHYLNSLPFTSTIPD